MHYIQNLIKQGLEGRMVNLTLLMGEGFILVTRGYGFDTLKIGTSTDDIKLELYR